MESEEGVKGMNNELIIKKCLKCGAIVRVIKDCDCQSCGIVCCDEKMQVMKANSTDAVVEKHVPAYEIAEDVIKVKVNHVMEEDHFIEWICLKSNNKEQYVYLKPNEEAIAIFENVQSGILYAYCNKHGLWNAKIDK